MNSPTHLDLFGVWNIIAPAFSFCVAFAPLAIYTYPRNKKVFAFLTLYYIFACILSQFPAASSSTEWQLDKDLFSFAVFAGLPFVAILSFYHFLYAKDAKIKDLMFKWPADFLCAHQLYRLGGGVFLYLYTEKGYQSYFNLQTGVLDIFMGLTAIPMALYVRNKSLNDVKSVLLAWHALGLFDLLFAFSAAGFDFFGVVKFEPPLAYAAFAPITLICYYQVAWAIAIHTMYLTSFRDIVKAQETKLK